MDLVDGVFHRLQNVNWIVNVCEIESKSSKQICIARGISLIILSTFSCA